MFNWYNRYFDWMAELGNPVLERDDPRFEDWQMLSALVGRISAFVFVSNALGAIVTYILLKEYDLTQASDYIFHLLGASLPSIQVVDENVFSECAECYAGISKLVLFAFIFSVSASFFILVNLRTFYRYYNIKIDIYVEKIFGYWGED